MPDVLSVRDILAEVLTVPVIESVDEPDSVGAGDSVMASDRVGVPVWVTEVACVNVVVCDAVNLDDVCDPVWEGDPVGIEGVCERVAPVGDGVGKADIVVVCVTVTLGDGKLEQAFGGDSAGPASDVTCSAGSQGAAMKKEVGAHAAMDAPVPNASTPE